MKYSQEYLKQISKVVENNIEKLWEKFGITVSKFHGYYGGTCPVHGGDNTTAFQFMMNNDGVYHRPRWRCWTHSCHERCRDTTIGLIQCLLSHRGQASFFDAVEWIEKNFPVNGISLETDETIITPNFSIPPPKLQLTKAEIRGKINIPSRYFQSRGFSPKLLDFHDVGPFKKPENGLFYREVVPVYDLTGTICIGATCRSVFEECPKCHAFHDPKRDCPKPELLSVYCKWKNWQFRKAFSLYNYWWANKTLQKTRKAILVEGIGDTWALKAIGIENVVSAYGRHLSFGQLKLLLNAGVEHLYVAFDNDQAGQDGFKQLGKKYWQDVNIHKIEIPHYFHDIGEIPEDHLYKIIRKEYGS